MENVKHKCIVQPVLKPLLPNRRKAQSKNVQSSRSHDQRRTILIAQGLKNANGNDLKFARRLRTTFGAMRSWGLEFRLLAWPLRNVLAKAKLQKLSRITKVDWPTAISPIAHEPMLGAVHSKLQSKDFLNILSQLQFF